MHKIDIQVNDSPDKEFNITIKKILNKLEKMMHEQNVNINLETEYFKNPFTALKFSAEGLNNGLDQTEERIQELKDKSFEKLSRQKSKNKKEW